MLTTVFTYYGAVVGVLSALNMALGVIGLRDTKFGQIVATASTDLAGIYQLFAPKK